MSLEAISGIQHAEQLESEGRLKEAAAIYEQVVRSKPAEAYPYDRLMIVYRKLRQPKDELRIIKFAISVFEARYIKKSKSKKLTALSNALMKTSGLGNGKGKVFYYPEPIGKWQKRKEVMEKKLK